MPGELVLALNCGSSSVKWAVLDPSDGARSLSGSVEDLQPDDVASAVRRVVDGLPDSLRGRLCGVGHRVVHGGPRYAESVLIAGDVLEELRRVRELAPLQMPGNLAGIEAGLSALPDLPHVAAFDTGFHRTLPPAAYRYAVPRAWYEEHGVRRYGFHGLSHRYVSARAASLVGRPLDELRMVTLHLGSGCSACAVLDGVSVDTTMGLTPLEGLVMGSRSGDVDAGALAYVSGRTGLGIAAIVEALNHESGLLGLSGESNDLRSVVAAAASGSEDAELALDVFCYRVAKSVGAYAVALGRLDLVVFTGGIGERSVDVRSRVLALLSVFGVVEDSGLNAAHGRGSSGRISRPGDVAAMVVPTDEELVIAQDIAALVGPS